MSITITVRYSDDAMFGSNGYDGYDAEASFEKFESRTTEEIAKINSNWEVEFDHGINDDVKVICDTVDEFAQHDEIKSDVESVIGTVWQDQDWMVTE